MLSSIPLRRALYEELVTNGLRVMLSSIPLRPDLISIYAQKSLRVMLSSIPLRLKALFWDDEGGFESNVIFDTS